MSQLKLALVFFFVLAFSLFFYFDFHQVLSFEYLVSQKERLHSLYEKHTLLFLFVFYLTYSLITSLSLPGAAILTLLAGFLFSFFIGVIVVILASNTGATLSFLASRFLFQDLVKKRFKDKFQMINQGFEKEGLLYLFSLRLIPFIPFFLINILMGLTTIKVRYFVLASAFGMLPGTLVYVNAGKELGKLNSASDLLSLPLILSFLLLALFPFLVKTLWKFFKDKVTT